MSDRFSEPLFQASDSNGKPFNGAKLNFYRTGTTTPKNTYSDSAKTIANANPVVSDAAGRFPDIFMLTDEAYAAVYTDADDNVIDTLDPVYPVLPPGTFPIIAVSNKSSNYTVLTTDRGADILVDASSGPVTISLLPVATATSGFVLTIVKTDSSVNVVTVDGDLAETINGLTTVKLGEQFDGFELGTEGTLWYIKSEKRLPTPTVATADEIVTVNSAGNGYTTTTNPLPPGHLTGLTLSNNSGDATNSIDIAVGKARSDADDANLSVATIIGKDLSVSWAAGGTTGTPTGGLSSSLTLTNDTWYHVHAGLVSSTVEVGIDDSFTGATLVADHSFSNLRRIGSVKRLTATNRIFVQYGDEVWHSDPPLNVDVTDQGTTAISRTLEVPPGASFLAIVNHLHDTTGGGYVYIRPDNTDITDEAPSDTAAPLAQIGGESSAIQPAGQMFVRTDATSGITTRATAASTTVRISTLGYVDRRGRDG